MALDIDLDAFRNQLARTFRKVTVEADFLAGFPFPTLTIDGAPAEITVLFEQSAVIQADRFTTEASYDESSFQPVIRELERMARKGYHARKGLFGTTSRLGEATRTNGVLTTAPPWPEALKA